MKKSYDLTTGILTFTSDDSSVQTINARQLSQEILWQATLHGLSQKIGDSYAGAAKEADPEAFARDCVRDTIAQLVANQWKAAGGGGTKYGILAHALSLATGKTVEEAAAILKDLSEKETKELQAKPKMKAAIAKVKMDREAAKLAAAIRESEAEDARNEADANMKEKANAEDAAFAATQTEPATN